MASAIADWSINGIKDPLRLQSLVLDMFEQSTDGKFTIADGNNVTAFLIESFASIASKSIQKIDDYFLPAAYASRAESITDLYRHLSDYDYLGLFATPAGSAIILIVDRSYLMKNAIDVTAADGTTTYKKVVIPQTTRFTIGSYTFGIYYPIEIRVSAQTGMFTVMYDTTVTNSLHVLSENVLEYNFHKNDGMDLAYIKIHVYQFNTETYIEPLVAGTGFSKTIDYSNKFHAIKITGDVRDTGTNTWVKKELNLALDGRTYNSEEVTAIFSVDPSTRQLLLDIPYVYFTEDRIRGNLRIDVYTTSGMMNYQIPSTTEEMVTIDMFGIPLDAAVQPYVEPFRTMPALGAVPVTMSVIGGTDGMDYTELRRRVVNNAFGDMTLQTPADVDTYFANVGYVTSLFQDGITDRVYNAHAVLRNVDNSIVASASINTLFTKEALLSANTRSIVDCGNDTFTILPATRYLFDETEGVCKPISDNDLADINKMSATNKVSYFNNHTVTLSPFHLQLCIKDKYPTSRTFDMTDADITSREYLMSRDIDKHLSLHSSLMEVVPVDYTETTDGVTDQYKFRFNVLRSGLDGFEAVAMVSGSPIKNIRMFVGLKTLSGEYTFAEATFVRRVDDTDEFELVVSGTAVFAQTNGGYTCNIVSPFSETGITVSLSTEMRVIICLNGLIDDVKNTYSTKTYPYKYLDINFTQADITDVADYIALSEHRVNVRFGALVNEVDQRISLVYSGLDYERYGTTAFSLLETDVFKKDSDGNYMTEAVGGDPTKRKLVLKHRAGTLKCFADTTDAVTALKDKLVISRYLGSNYAGCSMYVETSVGGSWDSTVFNTPARSTDGAWDLINDDTQYVRYEGKELAVQAHVVPRFYVTAAKLFKGAPAPVLGMYELALAGSVVTDVDGRLSHSTDRWYKASSTVNADTGDRTVITHSVRVEDALKFVVYNVLTNKYTDGDGVEQYSHRINGLGIQDPLKELIKNPTNGEFILVENDATNSTPPPNCDIADTYNYDTIAKLYYRVADTWVCVLRCNSFTQLKTYVDNQYRITEDTQVDPNKTYYLVTSGGYEAQTNLSVFGSMTYYEKEARHCGYVYVLDICEQSRISSDSTYIPSTVVDADNWQQYVAWVTLNDDGSPNFTVLPKDATDSSWLSRGNKWPWEMPTWLAQDKVTLSAYNRIVYKEDSNFTMRLDTARLTTYCLHTSNQIKLNANGDVTPTNTREVQYLVNMLHVDAKLAETSDAKSNLTYPGTVVDTMRSHFGNLGAIKNRLYTNTKLYFEPMKSLGYADFYTDGANITEYPLDINMGFKLHVSPDIADDDDMMASLRAAIISLIDDHMSTGNTNLAQIAQAIRENNSDSVRYVDVLGIGSTTEDLDPIRQTMRCVDAHARPHLRHTLELLDDGSTIALTRGLHLEFVVADN